MTEIRSALVSAFVSEDRALRAIVVLCLEALEPAAPQEDAKLETSENSWANRQQADKQDALAPGCGFLGFPMSVVL